MTALQSNWNNSLFGVAFNDISIDEGGNLRLVNNVIDVEQTINQSIWTWIGEYDFNTTLGVPYKLILGNTQVDQSLVQYYLTNAIMSVNNYLTSDQFAAYGINDINDIVFSIDRKTRAGEVEILITLNNGLNINLS